MNIKVVPIIMASLGANEGGGGWGGREARASAKHTYFFPIYVWDPRDILDGFLPRAQLIEIRDISIQKASEKSHFWMLWPSLIVRIADVPYLLAQNRSSNDIAFYWGPPMRLWDPNLIPES